MKTVAQWQRDTGLTRTELETARRKLKARIVGGTRRHGPPPAPLQFSDQPGGPVRPIARPSTGAVGRSAVTSLLQAGDRVQQCGVAR
jgi:hypothetical protein